LGLEIGRAEFFQRGIIEWYRVNGDKGLPWRNTRDPWAVLVAAFMLRKTTTRQVLRVYKLFLEKYPSPEKLVGERTEDVESILRPLGIERQRAVQIKRVAEHIVGRWGGRIPCDRQLLKELPGVGDYIASEVLLVACGQPQPLLDRNMVRMLERFFGVKSSRKRPHTDPSLWKLARRILPRDPELAKEFNYGVLDFARSICTASRPKCEVCVLRGLCKFAMEKKSNTLRRDG